MNKQLSNKKMQKGEKNTKVKVGWANDKSDFVCSLIEGEWIITTDNELMPLGMDGIPKGVTAKDEIFFCGLAPHHTTDWLRFFCEEHHPDIDFDEEFETDKPGVFARYQEKFGYDYEEWVTEKKYMVLRQELLSKGYDLPWE